MLYTVFTHDKLSDEQNEELHSLVKNSTCDKYKCMAFALYKSIKTRYHKKL